MRVVLDASMTIAWLFADERTAAAHAVMLRIVADGAFVPSLWRLEVAKVLRNAVRRERCDEAYVDRSLERLARFPIEDDDETHLHAWKSTRALAREHGLTLYDAAYLELAIRLEWIGNARTAATREKRVAETAQKALFECSRQPMAAAETQGMNS